MDSRIGPAGPTTEEGTPYVQYVVRADTEREAMNALMQQIIDIVLAKRQGSVVWRVLPYVTPVPHPGTGYAARARFCVI